jgi:hypothetical protein
MSARFVCQVSKVSRVLLVMNQSQAGTHASFAPDFVDFEFVFQYFANSVRFARLVSKFFEESCCKMCNDLCFSTVFKIPGPLAVKSKKKKIKL